MTVMKNPDRESIEDIYALTPMQEGMLYYHLKDPQQDPFFEQLCVVLTGSVDLQRFEMAWQAVVDTNESLRTLFRWEKLKSPVQMVLKEHPLDYRFYDLREGTLEEIRGLDRQEVFDLRRVPFRITLCLTGEQRYAMIMSHHHILFDGWSSGILLKEFWQAYRALHQGKALSRPVKTPFKVFVRYLGSQDQAGADTFWKGYLEEFDFSPAPFRGPLRPERGESGYFQYVLGPGMYKRLERLGHDGKITAAAVLYTAWGMLLQQYQRRRDVIFAVTGAGRNIPLKGVEDMVGLFITTLPLRVNCRFRERVSDVLADVDTHLRERESVPAASTVLVNDVLEKAGRTMLFDSVVVVENYLLNRETAQPVDGLTMGNYSIMEHTGRDLTVIITPFPQLEIGLAYNESLFDQERIRELCRHFEGILEKILTHPGGRIDDIESLYPAEARRITVVLRRRRQADSPLERTAYAAPEDERQERLVSVWAGVLQLKPDRIGIDDNFFDFGGHSLRAFMLVNRLHKETDVKVPLAEIFQRPTIRQLAAYIGQAKKEEYISLEAAEKRDYYAVSSAQKRFYMLHQLEPGNTAYNVSTVMEVKGRLHRDRLQDVFTQLVRRFEVLRTSFGLVDGEPVQRIHCRVEFSIESWAGPEYSAVEKFIRPFRLSQPPLMRVGLVPLEAEKHLLMLDLHHIITDGISMDLFIRAFIDLYRGVSLPLPRRQYKDFSRWQLNRLAAGELQREATFWSQQLAGELPVLNLLTDFPRPSIQSFAGDRVYVRLDEELCTGVYRLTRQSRTTLFMVLLAALNALLYRYTGQEDILVGTTVAGRDHPDTAEIMGLFIETLVMRNRPRGGQTFSALLQAVRRCTLDAFSHRAYPFGELLKKMADTAVMDVGMNPLFNVMLIVQNVPMTDVSIEGLSFAPVRHDLQTAKVDITLEAAEMSGSIGLHMEYCRQLFRKDTVRRLMEHLVNLLQHVVHTPDTPLDELEVMGEAEQRRLVQEFSGSRNVFEERGGTGTEGCLVHAQVLDRAQQTPHHPALYFDDPESGVNQQVTYDRLIRQAEVLAKLLEEL